MTYLCRPPDASLRDIVDHLWVFEDFTVATPGGLLFADGCVDLMFNISAPIASERRGYVSVWQDPWVSGPRSQALRIGLTSPRFTIVGARLLPAGVAAVLGAPAAEVADDVVELREFWREGAAEVRDRIASAATPAARLDALEAAIAARIAPRCLPRAGFSAAVQDLRHGVRITEVVQRLGISHKHLTRLFRTHVGLSPKIFQRVHRFRTLLRRLGHTRGRPDWVALALEGGYADQAHLCRDFREFSGLTPTRFETGWCEPDYLPYGRNDAIVTVPDAAVYEARGRSE